MEDIKTLVITDEIIEILIAEEYLPKIPEKEGYVSFLNGYYKVIDYIWETQNPDYYGFSLTKTDKVPTIVENLCGTCFEILVEAEKYGLAIENCQKIKIHDFITNIDYVYIQGWEEYLTVVVKQ